MVASSRSRSGANATANDRQSASRSNSQSSKSRSIVSSNKQTASANKATSSSQSSKRSRSGNNKRSARSNQDADDNQTDEPQIQAPSALSHLLCQLLFANKSMTCKSIQKHFINYFCPFGRLRFARLAQLVAQFAYVGSVASSTLAVSTFFAKFKTLQSKPFDVYIQAALIFLCLVCFVVLCGSKCVKKTELIVT
jgi:cobalamin biosynthesis Mg chelatase CobN